MINAHSAVFATAAMTIPLHPPPKQDASGSGRIQFAKNRFMMRDFSVGFYDSSIESMRARMSPLFLPAEVEFEQDRKH